jgi:thioredoxin reductase
MATKTKPKAPSSVTCASTGQESDVLTEEEIKTIFSAYKSAAGKAVTAGFDLIEIQGGHGYLISQFLNAKINKRTDRFGQDRLLFAREVLSAIKQGAPEIPCILRISGNEMSPEYGISREDLVPLLILAQESGIAAVHVGMGSSCFSPPWYFHHASLPEKPQMDTLSWVRKQTKLPLIIAGRMGRSKKILDVLDQDLADLVALGRPLIADPEFIEKLQLGKDKEIVFCGYCLQGCLHRLKSGEPLGCNLNPEMGQPELKPTTSPIKVLIAGGGPAGMSASLYLTRRGHKVTLVEKSDRLGGQYTLAWQAPGKEKMKDGLDAIEHYIKAGNISILLNRTVDAALVREIQPDLVVWATGAIQNIPDIQGLDSQYTMTSLEYFQDDKEIRGPRVLVIGAGRVGVEIVERLGHDGYEVVATKRTDPIGSMMEMITKTLALKRIGEMPEVTIMPHTTVKGFSVDGVEMEKDGAELFMEPFQTVILASGMLSEACPDEEILKAVSNMEIIGDAKVVKDIYSAIHAGYELAVKY